MIYCAIHDSVSNTERPGVWLIEVPRVGDLIRDGVGMDHYIIGVEFAPMPPPAPGATIPPGPWVRLNVK